MNSGKSLYRKIPQSNFAITFSTHHLLSFTTYDQNFMQPPLTTVVLSPCQEWRMCSRTVQVNMIQCHKSTWLGAYDLVALHCISCIAMYALQVVIKQLPSSFHALSNCSVKKMQGWGFANMLTFAFMHHPYLVCILFGMPSLHHFTFLIFWI